MARYLVTGGAGFIGAHLTARLLREGHAVRVLDDLSTGRPSNLPSSARCELVVGDVADRDRVRRCAADADGCFHLAAIASVARCTDDWPGSHRVNLTGSIQVLDAARLRLTPVVYASSAAVYGDSLALPLAEDAAPRPLSAYAADKLGTELHARVAAHVHGLSTVGLRFFNVYGPGQDPRSPYAGVISLFADRLRLGLPLDLHGDGGQVRDFVHVADVVAFLLAAMRRASAPTTATATAATYNVCTGRPTTVRDLAATLADLAGREPEFRERPVRAGDVRRSLGDPSLAERELGCRATTTLRDGLRGTLASLARAAGRPAPAREVRGALEPVAGR